MSRLREGRANTARGAAHFLRETVGRVRYGGARGQLTVRADIGFYAHTVVAACREMDVRFSITIRQRASLRDLIEAIPEEDWTPIPYWMDGAADVAETTYTPFQTKPDAPPVRLIVRRVKPTPAGAGRHWPPGDGRQRGCGYGRDCSVAASIGCSLFPGGFLFQNHYPRFRGAPSSFFKGCPQRPSFGGFGFSLWPVSSVNHQALTRAWYGNMSEGMGDLNPPGHWSASRRTANPSRYSR